MGGWNRSRNARGYRDRRPPRPSRPPPDYGHKNCSVPLWEREFCCYVGDTSWQRFCENKQYVGPFQNLDHWDDLGALENFQNAKARFWANYHGHPSDIPLPDPDLYIDKVDHHCEVDPELAADIDKLRLPFDSDDNSAAATEAEKKSSQDQSGNWDINIEKQAENNNWGLELTSIPQGTWGVKPKQFSNWGNIAVWGDPLPNPSSHDASNNNYSSNNRDDFHAGSSNRNQDRSNMSGRKRSSGGNFHHRNTRQKNQAEGYYPRSGWQYHGGRNGEWHPGHNRDRLNGQGY